MSATEMIRMEIDCLRGMQHPALLQRFVLRNGREFVPAPYLGGRLTPKQCFQNSMLLSMRKGMTYVEGLAAIPEVPMLFHHAWCEDVDGRLVDPTWSRPETCSYYGVPFTFDEVADNWQGAVLDTSRGLNVTFMRGKDPEMFRELQRSGLFTTTRVAPAGPERRTEYDEESGTKGAQAQDEGACRLHLWKE